MDLQKALGAAEAATVDKFSIYLPDLDQSGAPVPGIGAWIEAGLHLMAHVNGGATCLPPGRGIWGSNSVTIETTYVIYSFIRCPDNFIRDINQLTAFLHTFGKYTNQGEVMADFCGEGEAGYISRAYYIRDYDQAGAKPDFLDERL